MTVFREVVTVFFLISGLGFMLVGVLGVVRFPDAYQRLHASSKCTTLGLMGLLLGAAVHIGTTGSILVAALTIGVAFVANPVGSHALAKSAHQAGLPQWEGTLSDDLADDKRTKE